MGSIYLVTEGSMTSQMPTFMVFKGGLKEKEVVGANPGALEVSIASFHIKTES